MLDGNFTKTSYLDYFIKHEAFLWEKIEKMFNICLYVCYMKVYCSGGLKCICECLTSYSSALPPILRTALQLFLIVNLVVSTTSYFIFPPLLSAFGAFSGEHDACCSVT